MKKDTQHLDFLISQYVDGCLDTGSRKSVEQQMLMDPAARKLYQEHQDVQDLLDDWGNRIPLIDWDSFDKTLAGRLEKETVGGDRMQWFKRWGRPMAAAAALFIAATAGYGWHAWWSPRDVGMVQPVAKTTVEVLPRTVVSYEGGRPTGASQRMFRVEEAEGQGRVGSAVAAGAVAISAPGDAAAVESLKEAVGYGLLNVTDSSKVQPAVPGKGTWAVGPLEPKREQEAEPAFP